MKVTLESSTPDPEQVIGKAAGICYGKTDFTEGRVKGVIRNKHLACLRFAYANIRIEGLSIGAGRQMVRHKFISGIDEDGFDQNLVDDDHSFLQQSTRYVEKLNFTYVTPQTIIDAAGMEQEYQALMLRSSDVYSLLLEHGVPKEDARNAIPLGATTEIEATGNFQAWYDFLYGDAGRLQKGAQWEIRLVAQQVEQLLSEIFPYGFGEGRVR
jgi:thymidylate synthase ThyX